jgi:hypothetical protein
MAVPSPCKITGPLRAWRPGDSCALKATIRVMWEWNKAEAWFYPELSGGAINEA